MRTYFYSNLYEDAMNTLKLTLNTLYPGILSKSDAEKLNSYIAVVSGLNHFFFTSFELNSEIYQLLLRCLTKRSRMLVVTKRFHIITSRQWLVLRSYFQI